jgi:alpha-N-acetylglucosamine transferase
MVADHFKQPYRFVCLDDSPFSGWWSKISLFEPGRFSGRVLYLDLDVTVVGALDDLADYPYLFAAIRDYQYPLQINSSVMSWDASVSDCVYNDFTPEVMDRLHGDQNFIYEKINPVTFPKRWCPSYKAHVLPTGKVPNDARVIVYHGSPKPWDI